ncbi:MAG: sulfotransferase [Chitinophagaceae bacterium]|nr:sulfotransferase [Chitinophagaceae bacterium]
MSDPLPGIQFIGTQRSGSNLLRVMLEQHPAIAAPHPPHLLHIFMPLLHLYDPLNEQNYRLLVSDMVDYVNANPVPWEAVQFDKEAILAKSRQNHIFEIFRLIYEAVAKSKSAQYWCCKSMQNLFYSQAMEAFGLNLKYIFLYRDGRDVALSFKKAIVGDKHVYHLAKQWKEEQDICLELYKQYGDGKVFLLNYEKLVAEPEKCVRSLCGFLNIEYRDEMMQFYESSSSRAAAAAGEMWKNLEKPVMQHNTNKYLKELSAEEIEIYEWVAGDTLQALGYALSSRLLHPELVSPEAVLRYGEENKEKKKQFMATAPKNDIEKRQAQLDILQSVKTRNTTR